MLTATGRVGRNASSDRSTLIAGWLQKTMQYRYRPDDVRENTTSLVLYKEVETHCRAIGRRRHWFMRWASHRYRSSSSAGEAERWRSGSPPPSPPR